MIKLENVCKAFGAQNILRNINIEVNKGDKLCIVGQSGCGKTTLINIIMGIDKPDLGNVSVEKARFSCVFQEDCLVPQLTAYKNIALVNVTANIYENAAKIGIAAELLQKHITELSGGEKRRIAILRAMLAQSDVVVLDEATKGLDKATEQLVLEYIFASLNGRALIAVTHSTNEANAIGGTLLDLT